MDMSTLIVIIFTLALCVLWGFPSLCLSIIADKTNTPHGWLAWIPIAQIYLICKITNLPDWWLIVCILPFVGIIGWLFILWHIPEALGVRGDSKILIIIPFINLFYLGYLAFRKEKKSPHGYRNYRF